MKMGNMLAGITLGFVFASSAVSAAETGVAASAKSSPESAGGFVYRPPMRGAPVARIGGGTRGIGDTTLELAVLAPDHTGLTTKEQPTLYWYVSEPVPARLEVTVINDDAIDPELEEIVATPGHAGIQKIDLAKSGTRLEPGLEYRWFVSVVADPGQRSNDIVASGTIQRITPQGALKARIAGADDSALVSIYAEEGVWYDAIDGLSRMIEKAPNDAALREQRAALLEQVGLQTAADYSRAPGQ
jgi:hypothetical protein